MKKEKKSWLPIAKPFNFLYYFLIIILFSSCAQYKTTKDWINWNVLFKAQSTEAQRVAAIDSIENYIADTLSDEIGKTIKVRYIIDTPRRIFCPCDKLLYNIRVDLLIDSSGGSVTTPPPPKKPPVATGSIIQNLNDNLGLSKPGNEQYSIFDRLVKISGEFRGEGTLVTVIDTGIDSTKFTTQLSSVLINSPQTFNNFVIDATNNSNFDDNATKHGTTVSAIVLDAFYEKIYPRFLVLKALDEHGVGSIYSVSCAMSYAIQRRSSVVNASWGYYGAPDPILHHYINLADRNSIMVVAAAGNDTAARQNGQNICEPVINGRNELNTSRMFYPACFKDKNKNWFVTVTGLSSLDVPCTFQNYSPSLVTVGVMNVDSTLPRSANIEKACCAYRVRYMEDGRFAEGSSFATPVVTGKIGKARLEATAISLKDYLNNIGVKSFPSGRTTISGQYLLY